MLYNKRPQNLVTKHRSLLTNVKISRCFCSLEPVWTNFICTHSHLSDQLEACLGLDGLEWPYSHVWKLAWYQSGWQKWLDLMSLIFERPVHIVMIAASLKGHKGTSPWAQALYKLLFASHVLPSHWSSKVTLRARITTDVNNRGSTATKASRLWYTNYTPPFSLISPCRGLFPFIYQFGAIYPVIPLSQMYCAAESTRVRDCLHNRKFSELTSI